LSKSSFDLTATGRSDEPNQINNALVFPGMFRGLLDGGRSAIDNALLIAAAEAIAGLVDDKDLAPDHIVPDIFDVRLVPAIAQAVGSR
jgi:malate dehydrogenase (oxaloacetate-decarboxylating)